MIYNPDTFRATPSLDEIAKVLAKAPDVDLMIRAGKRHIKLPVICRDVYLDGQQDGLGDEGLPFYYIYLEARRVVINHVRQWKWFVKDLTFYLDDQ